MSTFLATSSRSVRESASIPFSPILTFPLSTSMVLSSPSEMFSFPDVRVTLPELRKPPPFTVIPFLLAMTMSALSPATSTYPLIFVLFFPVISVTIRLAEPLLSRFLFLATSPAICVSTTTWGLLLRISPCSLTCNSRSEL